VQQPTTSPTQAAPLDALLVDAALGTFRRFAPDLPAARFAAALARRPGTTARRMNSLAVELAGIAAGTSTATPTKRDRRFADRAWTQNPVLRRILQTYLAATRTADLLVGDAALGWRDDARVRFLAENLEEALSPSNLRWLTRSR
jgi:polyhydroxyalkanoate synthase